jgi:membrane protein implicated in regulation of membrane protease activity
MAAARSLSLLVLPLAPPAPALSSRSAAPRRARNGFGGGAAGRLRLSTRLRPVAAAFEEVEQTPEMMRVASDDSTITATVVSALLTIAFVGLSLLTIGVGDAFGASWSWIAYCIAGYCCFSIVVPDYSYDRSILAWFLFLVASQVIYLAVQDFLQKRESEKFEREEAERQKEEARKKRAKANKRKRNRR